MKSGKNLQAPYQGSLRSSGNMGSPGLSGTGGMSGKSALSGTYSSSGLGEDTTFMRMLKSDLVLGINNKGEISVIKDRYKAQIGEVSTEQAIDLLMDMLSRKIFKNDLDIFQEGLKKNLIEAVKKTIKKERSDVLEESISRKS